MDKIKGHLLSFKPWSKHSGILVVAGIVYIVIGIRYYYLDPSENLEMTLYYAINLMPIDGWGIGFIVVGAIAVLSSRWPNVPASWGYVLLTGLSAAWSSFFFAGAMLTEARVSYFSTAAMWALLAYLWWAISGLVELKDDGR